MGWGLVAASRATLLDKCTLLKDPKACDYTIVDMCSESRRMASGKTPRPPAFIASSICRFMWRRTTKCLIMIFDNHDCMHPVRAELHRERYKPLSEESLERGVQAGKVAVNGQLYAQGMEPYTPSEVAALDADSQIVWSRMWSSGAGKRRAFELIRDACVVWHHAHAKDGHQYVMWHQGEPTAYPYDSDEARSVANLVRQNTFGEADFRLGEAIKDLCARWQSEALPEPPTMFVQTIDTDMIIQLVACKTVLPSSPIYLRLMNETLAVADLAAMFGGNDRERRLSAAFWLLCCNGVDYCKGLTRFGFNTAGMSACATTSRVVSVGTSDHATLHTHAVLQALAGVKKRKLKGRTWGEFSLELHRIMFCLSLFTGACKLREPFGGPDQTQGQLFSTHGDAFLSSDVGSLDAVDCTDITVKIDC